MRDLDGNDDDADALDDVLRAVTAAIAMTVLLVGGVVLVLLERCPA